MQDLAGAVTWPTKKQSWSYGLRSVAITRSRVEHVTTETTRLMTLLSWPDRTDALPKGDDHFKNPYHFGWRR